MDNRGRGAELAPLGRILIIVLGLCAFILVPFLIWGEQMDEYLPKMVENKRTVLSIALTGVVLLTLDVFLPLPSSIISISLCLLLGPLGGASAVFVGMIGSFTLGYLAGRLAPATHIRTWVGPDTWDWITNRQQTPGMLWIAATRPIPVLAEVTAILAGTLRFPLGRSFLAAGSSSALAAAAYGGAAWMSLDQASSSTVLFVAFAAFIPITSWSAFKLTKRVLQ
jgi:uncharacterized membrane protein YdjX (TVP38/TMEM64 family)